MSVKENKVLVRRIYELINQGKYLEAYDFCAPGFKEHMTDRDMSKKQAMKFEDEFLADFPDINVTINDMVAEGDKVAVFVTWKGTHKVTGKKIEMTNANIFRIADGQWVETWNVTDIRLAEQLGNRPR
jgi:predicted SnoaL-like aldol condensation-catalyzing enzyme